MADYDSFRWGSVQYPLASPSANTALRDVDPALYWALEFWAQMLTTHLGARLIEASSEAGGLVKAAVAVKLGGLDPLPYLFEYPGARFPLLAAYRVTSRYAQRTMTWEQESTEIEVSYVLPHMNWQEAEKVAPMLHAVEQILCERTSTGYDSTWLAGAKVWSAAYAGVERIGLVESRYGRLPDANSKIYLAWQGRFDVKELVRPSLGTRVPFAGADVIEDLADTDRGLSTLEGVVALQTDVPPPEPGP